MTVTVKVLLCPAHLLFGLTLLPLLLPSALTLLLAELAALTLLLLLQLLPFTHQLLNLTAQGLAVLCHVDWLVDLCGRGTASLTDLLLCLTHSFPCDLLFGVMEGLREVRLHDGQLGVFQVVIVG